ncbi:MAG: hypothetical protein J6Y08_10870 [Clostridiales bacterium]|nr:hypothetical protein [Clostridiales bacterium]
MPETNVTPVSLKCKICGGDVRANYHTGACVCIHCGNKWALQDVVPNYEDYSTAIDTIHRAKALLEGNPDVTDIAQARLLFQYAKTQSLRTDELSMELQKICKEGQAQAEQLRHYAMGKKYYDKKNYKEALSEFKKVPDVKDASTKIEELKVLIEKERKKRIPLSILIGMVLPTVLGIVLKEKAGLPLYVVIPVGVLLTAVTTYFVYLDGIPALIIQILSFLSAVPLILFLILAYGFHVDVKIAAIIAIGAPIVLVLFVMATSSGSERKE